MAVRGGEVLEIFLTQTERRVTNADTLRVGFPSRNTYGSGTPVAYVAVVNEFGYAPHNIPSRPFFRTMIAEKSPQWPAQIAGVFKDNEYDSRKTLDMMGVIIEGQLKDSIVNGGWAPNAPSTVKRKGSSTPLVDTTLLTNSVSHEVE